MSWFKRTTKGIRTSTQDKKDTPQGLWYKSPTGKIIDTEELAENFYVSPEDGYHVRVGSQIYFDILFDEGKFRDCLLYTSPSPRDRQKSRMPSSA